MLQSSKPFFSFGGPASTALPSKEDEEMDLMTPLFHNKGTKRLTCRGCLCSWGPEGGVLAPLLQLCSGAGQARGPFRVSHCPGGGCEWRRVNGRKGEKQGKGVGVLFTNCMSIQVGAGMAGWSAGTLSILDRLYHSLGLSFPSHSCRRSKI